MAATQVLPLCWRVTLMPLVSTASRAPVCTKPSAPHFVWVCYSPRVSLICRCLECVGVSTPKSLEPVVTLLTCAPDCGAHPWDTSSGQGQPPWGFSYTPLQQAAQPNSQFISKCYPLNLNTTAPPGDSQWVASRAPPLSRIIGRPISPRAAAASSGRHGIRRYYQSTRGSGDSQHQLHIVDLRSDTLSTPCAEMRSAMAHAEVGDDAFVEDPTVNEFQQQVAKIFGTEDALFVTSGTMGNLVSVMCHCRNRGEELLVGDQAHLYLYEQGGVAQIAGVSPRLVTNLSNGQLDLEELESKIQKEYPNPHYARTRLICLENTHNRTGGRILPLTHLREVRLLADRYGLAVHLDGARLINAAVALGVAPAEIVQYCDSVSLCLTKGLGAPVGAVIGGCKEFIKECLRARKVLGGGMRQAGILAAAGLLALSQAEDTVREDHHRAKKFATGVQQLASSICSVDLPSVETNMVMLTVDEPRISPQEFCERMWDVSEAEILELGRGVKVRMFVMYKRTVRLVWYRNISEEDTEMALNKLKFVVQKYSAELGIV